jgi:imidazolonepropionase-like amidohydrolase
MRHGDELGQVKEGWLADLLLVDGDPLKDLSLLVGPDHLAMIMKDGRMHKDPRGYRSAERIAAE